MLRRTSFFLGVAALVGCGGSDSNPDGSVTGDGALAVRPGFCTTWYEMGLFNVVCLSGESKWEPFERTSFPGSEPKMCAGGGEQLAGTAGTGMILVHRDCVGDEPALVVARATETEWEPVGDPLNSDGSNGVLSIYAQFGPALASFKGEYYGTWTQWPTSSTTETALSRFNGTSWARKTLVTAPNTIQRHPTFFATDESLYVFYGDPAPSVWEVTGGTVTSKGSVDLEPEESTLYSSLASWKGQLVLAYSSGPDDAARADSTFVTKVAFHEGGTNWTVDANPIEDTPGRDGLVPFLFTMGDDLFIMYADYTTEGVTDEVGDKFRFRVKRWSGSTWVAVGTESPPLINSQRLEYLVDGDTVLVGVNRAGGQHIVLGWRDGTFGQVGDDIGTSSGWDPRPGAVIAPPLRVRD